MKGIGTRIKAGRVAAGLTQERLAEKSESAVPILAPSNVM